MALDRWHATIVLQKAWRGKLCRIRINKILTEMHKQQDSKFMDADKFEAALLIQTQFRRKLARLRVRNLKEQKMDHESQLIAERKKMLCDVSDLDDSLFAFSSPPTDIEMGRLFAMLDNNDLHLIHRRHCYRIYTVLATGPVIADDPVEHVERMLSPYTHFGSQRHFDSTRKEIYARYFSPLSGDVAAQVYVAEEKQRDLDEYVDFEQFCVFVLRVLAL